MGLDKVEEEVLSSGHQRRKEILDEAEAEARKLLDDARAQVATYEREKGEETRSRVERTRVQELETAEITVRRFELTAQRELLERVRVESMERLQAMDRPRRQALLQAILSKHQIRGGRIFSAPQDEGIVRALSNMRYGGHIECLGGVVMESEDGAIREDYTFGTLLGEKYEQLLPVIADILMGKGG